MEERKRRKETKGREERKKGVHEGALVHRGRTQTEGERSTLRTSKHIPCTKIFCFLCYITAKLFFFLFFFKLSLIFVSAKQIISWEWIQKIKCHFGQVNLIFNYIWLILGLQQLTTSSKSIHFFMKHIYLH